MSYKRTTRRATRLLTIRFLRSGCFAILTLATLHSLRSGCFAMLSLAAAPQAYPLAASPLPTVPLPLAGAGGMLRNPLPSVGMLRNAGGTWTDQAPAAAPSARYHHVMAHLGGDRALLFGGWDASEWNGETWLYDLSDNTWANKAPNAPTPSARQGSAMAALGGGQTLLFGGQDLSGYQGGYYDSDTWVYDLSANTWTQLTPTGSPSGRYNHAMVSVDGGQVVLFGGYDWSADGETWVYDPSNNTWTDQAPDAPTPSGRWSHGMASIGGDQVLLFGGWNGSVPKGETWVYDLSDNTWTQKNPAVSPSDRDSHMMAYLGGDRVLLFGGYDANGHSDETWVYDLSDNTWTQQTPAATPSARRRAAVVSLGVDQVLLFGGHDDSGYDDETWLATGFFWHRQYLPLVVK